MWNDKHEVVLRHVYFMYSVGKKVGHYVCLFIFKTPELIYVILVV